MRIDSTDAAFSSIPINKPLEPKVESQFKPKPDANEKASQQEQTTQQEKVSKAFIENAVGKANDTMKVQNRSLEFKVHERTNEIMVKIIDSNTKEVIREIPPEKLLDMFANMLELAGLLVDERR